MQETQGRGHVIVYLLNKEKHDSINKKFEWEIVQ